MGSVSAGAVGNTMVCNSCEFAELRAQIMSSTSAARWRRSDSTTADWPVRPAATTAPI